MLLTNKAFNRWFLHISGGILALTSIYKFYYLLQPGASLFAHPDPLVPVAVNLLMLAAAFAELVVAGMSLFARLTALTNLALLWLSLSFLTYRIGLAMLYPDYECPCLKGLSAIFPVNNFWVQGLLKAVLVFFIIGSSFFLFIGSKGDVQTVSP